MKIIILDFAVGDVKVLPMSMSIDVDDVLEHLEKDGKISSVSNCQWMIVETLKLTIF